MPRNSVNKFGAVVCFWASIVCAFASTYYFLIAPIDYVALGIVLFGAAIALQAIAALLTRHQNSKLRNGQTDESDIDSKV